VPSLQPHRNYFSKNTIKLNTECFEHIKELFPKYKVQGISHQIAIYATRYAAMKDQKALSPTKEKEWIKRTLKAIEKHDSEKICEGLESLKGSASFNEARWFEGPDAPLDRILKTTELVIDKNTGTRKSSPKSGARTLLIDSLVQLFVKHNLKPTTSHNVDTDSGEGEGALHKLTRLILESTGEVIKHVDQIAKPHPKSLLAQCRDK
jgi:hypothetical protein